MFRSFSGQKFKITPKTRSQLNTILVSFNLIIKKFHDNFKFHKFLLFFSFSIKKFILFIDKHFFIKKQQTFEKYIKTKLSCKSIILN